MTRPQPVNFPLPLSARPKTPIWGNGDWSALTGRPTDGLPPVGELWLNDDRPQGSLILSGPLAGLSLAEAIDLAAEDILGPAGAAGGRMAVLIKFLNPRQWLSVQLHPPDGHDGPGSLGKTEAWYVIAARPGAEIILGLNRGVGRDEVERAIARRELEPLLHRQTVAAGQAFLIPAGLVHAVGPGMLLFEIQQNNDVTYRFYDWDRTDDQGRPRPLHIAQGLACLEAIDPDRVSPHPTSGPVVGGTGTDLVESANFRLARLDLTSPHPIDISAGPVLLTGISGRGVVEAGGLTATIDPGATVLVPAAAEGPIVRPAAGEGLALLESR